MKSRLNNKTCSWIFLKHQTIFVQSGWEDETLKWLYCDLFGNKGLSKGKVDVMLWENRVIINRRRKKLWCSSPVALPCLLGALRTTYIGYLTLFPPMNGEIHPRLGHIFIRLGPTPPKPPSLSGLPARTCVGTLSYWEPMWQYPVT